MIEYLIGDIATVINIVAKGSAVLLLLLISEALLWYSRVKISREYTAAKKNVANLADIESVSLIYYRKRQMLGVVRAGVFLVAILFTALLYDFQTFGVLALALSALVIIQRENINSLIAYFFVLSNFNVGDDIRLGDALGEIVRVSPFQTVLNGKEDNGEYNGRLISIPNYKILIENVTKQELKSDTYRRIILKVVYENESYAVNFGEFIRKTRSFLDDFLPKRHLGEVGNFRRNG
jgi:small-conductance mechanosensitive channel